jgi:outer membrane lipoprotein-sorting protein
MNPVYPSPARLVPALLLFLVSGFSPIVRAASLDEALARMNQSAAGFKGLTAHLQKLSYTAVIKETMEESGTITLFRPKPRDLRMLVEFTKPDERAVSFAEKKVQVYYPKIKTVQEYDLGKDSSLVDQFLLLGFGTPGSELKKSYEVKYLGEETIGKVKADHLELTPLSEEARKHVRTVELWVSQAEGITVQQKVNQPSRDYIEISYSDIKVNPPLTESSVKLKLPKGVKKETPQR